VNELRPKDEFIAGKIFVIRNQKVMLDADLAELYGVETKALKQNVKRNTERFPGDFMFVLNKIEFENLRSQFVTSSWGGSRHLPMAFTEQGVAMLSGIIRSPIAINVNIQIMRVFVKMRKLISSYSELIEKVEVIEANAAEQNQHIIRIYEIIKELIEPSYKNRNPLGYRLKEERGKYIIRNN
jgi:hypothetical protein